MPYSFKLKVKYHPYLQAQRGDISQSVIKKRLSFPSFLVYYIHRPDCSDLFIHQLLNTSKSYFPVCSLSPSFDEEKGWPQVRFL